MITEPDLHGRTKVVIIGTKSSSLSFRTSTRCLFSCSSPLTVDSLSGEGGHCLLIYLRLFVCRVVRVTLTRSSAIDKSLIINESLVAVTLKESTLSGHAYL